LSWKNRWFSLIRRVEW